MKISIFNKTTASLNKKRENFKFSLFLFKSFFGLTCYKQITAINTTHNGIAFCAGN